MAQHTGKDMETIARDCERNYWLDAEEAVQYGVADRVLKHLPDSLMPPSPPPAQSEAGA